MKERKVCELATVNENIEDFFIEHRVKNQQLDSLIRHLLYYDEDSWGIGMRIWRGMARAVQKIIMKEF